MSFNFFKTKLFKIIVVIAIGGFFIFISPFGVFNPIRSVLFFIFSPIQKIVYGFSYECSSIGNFVGSIGQLKKENEKLIEENRDLKTEIAKLEKDKSENETLREELKILPRNKFNLEGAVIIGSDPSNEGAWVAVNKGKNNGIEKGMAVIAGKGALLGKIDEVYFSSSKVMLLTNTQSKISAIDSKTGAKGVVGGEYGLGIIFDMVLQSESLNVGDEIITSEIGKDIPSGLWVGTVQEIGSSSDRLFQRAIISPAADVSKKEFVFVIKENF
jgi:rod shape-determining protein MreC